MSLKRRLTLRGNEGITLLVSLYRGDTAFYEQECVYSLEATPLISLVKMCGFEISMCVSVCVHVCSHPGSLR